MALVAAAEWPRIARAAGAERGSTRPRGQRPARPSRPSRASRGGSGLRIVKDLGDLGSLGKQGSATGTGTVDADEFAASVRRDLDRLPTFERPSE